MRQSVEHLLSAPEGKTLEFKRDLSSPRNILKTLVAFANTAGGCLLVGVDDAQQVVGVAQPLDEEERLCSLIADSIAPRLVPNVSMCGSVPAAARRTGNWLPSCAAPPRASFSMSCRCRNWVSMTSI